ncbi:MAG TPA: hypothetical protein VHA56_00705 [Mucilaginibacter sp.]|nr:hypothetical protein [Mucilaginibacter sp.]
MFKKNSYITGILAALIFPAAGGVVAYYLRDATLIINRPALPYLIGVACNLIMMRFVIRKNLDKTGRGIMIATFVIMLLVFMFKARLR